MYKVISKQTVKNRRALNDAFMATCFIGTIPSHEPMFRHWNRIPQTLRDRLKKLKSDDIKNDVWHLR